MTPRIANNLMNLTVHHRDDKSEGKIIGVTANETRDWTFTVRFNNGTEADHNMVYLLSDGKELRSHLTSLGFNTSNRSEWLFIRKMLGVKKIDEEELDRLKQEEVDRLKQESLARPAEVAAKNIDRELRHSLRKNLEELKHFHKETEERQRLRRETEEQERLCRKLEEQERIRRKLEEQDLLRKEREITEEVKRQEELERQLQRQRSEALRIQAETLLKELRRFFRDDFLNVDSVFRNSRSGLVSQHDYEQEKFTFIKSWIAENTPPEKNGLVHLPDNEQAKSIAAVHGHVQVVARAGSGKTATLVNRAYFLQKHCGVKPGEMMLLAFNKKAAEEMEERLEKLLDGQSTPHVMTFHALAHALVHPEQNLIHDSSDGGNMALSSLVQDVVDNRLRDSDCLGRIRKVMLAHFRENWDKIVDGGYYLAQDEMLQYRRSLQRETLQGEFVKSFGEKLIANILFEHQVPYLYEPLEKGRLENYHPDFKLLRGDGTGVCIEYFGMAGDPDYDVMSDEKRDYWKNKIGWNLVEFTPEDITANGGDGFLCLLQTTLEKEGFTFRRMTEDELWHQIKRRAIDRFTAATRGFIARCRKLGLEPNTLALCVSRYIVDCKVQVECDFLDLMLTFFADYIERLDAEDKEDFDGLMHRATSVIEEGRTQFSRDKGRQNGDLANLRFMLIDEYQDFSKMFHSLVENIRHRNPNLQLFCVGDDWQAINGFAGSDLKYYRDFSKYFENSEQLYISTNYRSLASIVNIGNAVMHGKGQLAKAHSKELSTIRLADVDDFQPSAHEEALHSNDKTTPMVLRIIAKALEKYEDIVILSRKKNICYTNLYDYEKNIRSQFPEYQRHRIKVSTTHGFKGLQASTVIVLDAVQGCYPLLHQDWFFQRIFGDSVEQIVEAERRLFYVALTRAKNNLVIFTRKANKSPFLAEVEKQIDIRPIQWNDFPYAGPQSNRLYVKVGNQPFRGATPTINIKNLLSQEGYAYQKQNGWSCWVKSFTNEGFSIDLLKSSTWSPNSDGVEVRIIDDQDNLVGTYEIDNGDWIMA